MTQRKILMKSLGVIGSDFGPFSQLILSSEDESILTAFVVVQSLSHPDSLRRLPPWTAECKASLSFAISQNLFKLMSIELVTPSNTLIFCHPLLLPPSVFPSIRVSSNESVLCIRIAKVLELQLQSFQ